ncbi:MAG: TonB-dependent receptor [Calditrichia bacterium]
MRKFILTLSLSLTLAAGRPAILQAQVADSLQAPAKRQAELPEIQLKEYTIVGLAKITLPEKQRRQIFRTVTLNWIDNDRIWQRTPPPAPFRFSRIKPALLRLYEFPWLNGCLHYGSFNTAGICLNSQFKIGDFLPYFSADFTTSDGHVDNAQWTGIGFKTGFHYRLARNHLWHLGTDYRFNKQGIYGIVNLPETDAPEVQSTLWRVNTALEQQWTDRISTEINANLFLDELDNFYNYQDNGWQVSGRAALDVNKTRIGAEASAEHMKIDVGDGYVPFDQPTELALHDYESTLLNGGLSLQQQLGIFTARAGFISQSVQQQIDIADSAFADRNEFYPRLNLDAQIQDWGNLSLGYTPGMEMQRLRRLVRDLPFSEPGAFRPLEYSSRWTAALNVQFPPRLQLQLYGQIADLEDYLAPAASVIQLRQDWQTAPYDSSRYAGWVFLPFGKIRLLEWQIRGSGKISEKWLANTWLTLRQSDVKSGGPNMADVEGNEVPYFPKVTAGGALRFKFYREHEFAVSFDYTGERYDDPSNSNRLDGYFLLNARMRFMITENIRLQLSGNNLFDKSYELWRGFEAPGINGAAALQVIM